MSTPRFRWCPLALVLLLGAAAMAANVGCGRSGTGLGPGADASLAAGGSGGDSGGAGGSSGPGGTMDAGIGQGGASSSAIGGSEGGAEGGASTSVASSTSLGGFTTSPGGTTAFGGTGGVGGMGGLISWAGNGGGGGTNLTGGAKSSGGSTSSASATIVTPREPKLHRPQALSCVGVFAPPEPVSSQSSACKKHADCTQRTGGFCVLPVAGYARATGNYYCVYEGCAADADCGTGQVCFCSPNDVPRCSYASNCRTDADCGGGSGYCSPANGYDCSGSYRSYSGHHCHTPKDTCVDDSDCTGKDYCDYDPIDGRWECKPVNITCAIG